MLAVHLSTYFAFVFSLAATLPTLIQRNYDFYLISMNATWANRDLLDITLKAELISRGVYGVSGTLIFNFEHGDTEFLEAKLYHSAKGDNKFTLLPFAIKKMSMKEHMRTGYKSFVMKTVANCSDMPQVQANEVAVYEVGHLYKFSKCIVSVDHMPSHMVPGIYKAIVTYSGVVDGVIEAVAKAEPKD